MLREGPSVTTEHLLCFLRPGAHSCSSVLFEAVLLTCASPFPLCLLQDCPPEAGDFRAQQCSAHNDVKHHGQFYEWLPVSNDPDNPCSLKCQAKGTALVVELAPKVLDGTRCYTESLDMCISGLCQVSAGFFSFYFSRGFCVSSFCVVLLSESVVLFLEFTNDDPFENWGSASVKATRAVLCVKEKWTRVSSSFESHFNIEEPKFFNIAYHFCTRLWNDLYLGCPWNNVGCVCVFICIQRHQLSFT